MSSRETVAPNSVVHNSTEIARHNSKASCPILDKILDPEGPFLSKWNMIFVVSTVVAVCLDPLFLYIRIINQDMKCMQQNHNLKISAVIWRSITDLVYVMKIILQIYNFKKVTIVREYPPCLETHKTMLKIWESCIIVDILAVLPIPQVAILIVLPNLRGLRSLSIRKFMNFLVLFQYVPRLLRVYLACKEYKPSSKENSIGSFLTSGNIGLWLKGGLNFLMYILASHVFGAFWYFFSVQRMLDCWQYACQNDSGCKENTFSCRDHHTNKNITLLTTSCPISPANATIFDFGIFLGVLESSIAGSKDYPQTLSNCFWWGLKNLSSFGSNLEPSVDTWENLFAASISIIGLLLFLYLIGNVQIYMQNETVGKLEQQMKDERTKKIERKKGNNVNLWLTKNGLPMYLKAEIMETIVQQELKKNTNVDVDNILTVLSPNLRKIIWLIQGVNSRLSEYGIPIDKISEVVEKVRHKLDDDKDTDVEQIITALPKDLQSYIQKRKEEMEDKCRKTTQWLSENAIPLRKRSEVIEIVRQKVQEDGELDVESIIPILPPELQLCIKSFKQKMDTKGQELDLWFSKNRIPMRRRMPQIRNTVREHLTEERDVDVENILTILSDELQTSIKGFMLEIARKDQEVVSWLTKNGIPMSKISEIMGIVQQQLDDDENHFDVRNILSFLPSELETYVKSCIQKMEDKENEVHLFLSQNGWPMHKKSEIMDVIRRESQASRDVAVKNIHSILSPELQNYVKDFMRKMEEKSQQVSLWLSKYHVPMYKKSQIMYIVQKELANDRDVDVENMVTILPAELQDYIKNSWKIGEIDREVEFWLFQNGIPLHRKSKIMETVQKHLDEGKDVQVKNILSILPPQLWSEIKKYILDFEEKSKEASQWLFRNGISMHRKLEILGKVQQKLREEPDFDVENLYSILPPELQSDIQCCKQKMETRFKEVHMWLSKEDLPMHKESEIQEKVRQELVEERDVVVENIYSILSPELQSYFKSFKQRLKEKTSEVHLWLLQNHIPMHTESTIIEKVHQELREEKEVDVKNIVSILSFELQSLIKSFMSKMKEKDRQVILWLSENRIPVNTKPEIMVHVRKVLEENKEVDEKDILSILPAELKSYIESFKLKIKEKNREVDHWLSENGIPLRTKSEIMDHVQQALEEGRIVYMESILSVLPKEFRSYIKGCMQKTKEKSQEVDLWLTRNGWPMNKKSDILKKVRQELHEGREVDLKDIYSIVPSEHQSYITNFLSQVEKFGREVDLWLMNNWLPKHKKEKIMKIIRQELEDHRTVDVQNIHSMLKTITF